MDNAEPATDNAEPATDNAEPSPDHAPGLEAAVEVSRAFVGAVAWGEHLRVWELLGDEGRRIVLRLATRRGMDDALALRIRDGRATSSEMDTFLSDLVNGLRADLAGADLENLSYWADPAVAGPSRAWVMMMSPMPAVLGGDVPVGTLDLSHSEHGWRVERIIPRPRRPPE
ncbi:MAG: hypothetical protein ACRDX8_07650 [Acidimicrobiales bacterium]